ncbi:MAG TPA: hypothetical protein ENI36_00765 [Thermoplasmatales archaeon]|nr:hypothetical protein [Thermoplasmatales archaeon]
MARYSKLRKFLTEIAGSPLVEKISLILPFIILGIDIHILQYSLFRKDFEIVLPATILLALSIVEIIVVIDEIHVTARKMNMERELTIKLEKFIFDNPKLNVKEIVNKFVEKHPEYKDLRKDIYHITCQIFQDK